MLRRLLLPAVALALSALPAVAQDGKHEGGTRERRDATKPDADESEDAASEIFRKRLRSIDPKIEWEEGPCDGPIGDVAKLAVPEGVAYTGKEGTRRFLEANENIADGTEFATVQALHLPTWTAYFSYLKSGHVKDDDKHDLDAEEMLEQKKEECAAGNKERSRRGFSELEVVAWAVPPHYDEQTHNLEWGLRLRSVEGDLVNYEVRCLSRVGMVQAILVCGTDDFEAALPEFREVLGALTMNPGQRYDEVKPGDPIAEATLTTLIVGGAAALGWKAGIFKYLYKILIAVGVGVAALWRKITGRSKQSPNPVA